MGVRYLHVQGYRSLKDVVWEPGALNVIIGPNGSGKSNLLRSLELLSISARGGLGKLVRRSGGLLAVLWDGAAEGIRFALNAGILKTHDDSLSYLLEMAPVGLGVSYRIEKEALMFDPETTSSEQWPWPLESALLDRSSSRATILNEGESQRVELVGALRDEETVLSQLAGPFERNLVVGTFGAVLADWYIYHDIRVDTEAPLRLPAIARTETKLDGDGQNLIPVLHTLYTGERDFKKDVDAAMRAAFGDDYDELVFPPAADQRVQLRVRWKSLRREQSAADLSDGTLRFLFLIAALASPMPPNLIAIDEPETGLHPSMLPIVAEYAVDASRRTQVILTTHSPQFLDAFGETKPLTTVAKWSDGQTVLKTLDGDTLARWLKEYSLGSLFQSGELEDME